MYSIYGYIYNNKKEKDINSLVNSIANYGVEKNKIFVDIVNNKGISRFSYNNLKGIVKNNDVIVFSSINDLGESILIIQKEYKYFFENNINVVFLDNFSLSIKKYKSHKENKLVFNIVNDIFDVVINIDKKNLSHKQRLGIEKARENGVHLGRPKAVFPDNWEYIYNSWKKEEITAVQGFSKLNITKSTFYNLVKRWEVENL
jgi:DNA invertase Pin-like site-specific DNA recombinase